MRRPPKVSSMTEKPVGTWVMSRSPEAASWTSRRSPRALPVSTLSRVGTTSLQSRLQARRGLRRPRLGEPLRPLVEHVQKGLRTAEPPLPGHPLPNQPGVLYGYPELLTAPRGNGEARHERDHLPPSRRHQRGLD